MVFFFVSPPPYFEIKKIEKGKLKLTFYNTDLTKYAPIVKLKSSIISEIIPKQVKENAEVTIIFKREILNYTYLKSDTPSLIYLKINVGNPITKQPSIGNKTVKKLPPPKILKPAPKAIPKPKPKPKQKPKPLPKQVPKKVKQPKIPKIEISRAQSLYEQGLLKMSENKYDDAIYIFNTILNTVSKGNPYYVKAKFRIADCYYYKLDKRDPHNLMFLVKMYFQLVSEFPKSKESAWGMFQIGKCYKLLGFYEEALGSFKYIEKYFPESIYKLPSLFEIGEINYKLKRYNEAINYFQKIINNYPSRIIAQKAYYRLGDCYYSLGNFKSALKIYKFALKKWPNLVNKMPETLYNIGDTYFHLGKFKIARRYFLKIRSLYPKTVYVDIALLKIGETYVRENNLKNALFVFNRVIQIKKNIENEIIARFRMAEIGLNYKLPDELKKRYGILVNPEKGFLYIIKHFPDNKIAQISYSKLVEYYLKHNNYEKAVFYSEEFFKKYPFSPIKDIMKQKLSLSLKGYISQLYENEEYFKIITYYEKYKDSYLIKFKDFNTLLKIALSAKKFFMLDESSQIFKKLLKNAPENFKDLIEFNLIENQYYNRDYEKFFVEAKKFLEKFKNSVYINKIKFYLAEYYEIKKNYYNAIKILNQLKNENFKPLLMEYKIAKDYQSIGNFKKAYENFIIVLTPENGEELSQFVISDSYFQKAYIEFLQKRYQDCISSFFQFIQKFKNDKRITEALYYIALSYFKIQDYKSAKKWIKVLKKYKNDFWEKLGEHLLNRITWIENTEKDLSILD